MNKSQFISYIKNPLSMDEKALKSLDELAKTFPYCQISHILMAKATSDNNSMLANEKLRKAATYATDRKILKNIIQQKTPVLAEEKEEITTLKSIQNPTKPTAVEQKPTLPSAEIKKDSPIAIAAKTITDEIAETLAKSKALREEQEAFLKEKEQEKPASQTIAIPISEPKKKIEKITLNEEFLYKIGYSVYSSRLGRNSSRTKRLYHRIPIYRIAT
jgi:chromosome condensin MukBEF ATPase and DNA-binding subunit MukB